MNLLESKVALVTGAAQGIGLAISKELRNQGARVIMCDIANDSVVNAARALDPGGTEVLPLVCDVTDEASVERAVETTLNSLGRLDVVVNNAGINIDASIRRMTLDDFTKVLYVGLVGSWLVTRAASAVMTEGGSIVNMSSIAGKVGNAGQTNYSAAKAGIVGLTKASAKECARRGVRVNAIMPGLIRTPMTEAMPADVWDAKLAEIPLGRAGIPADVATVVTFLASNMSSYVTGTVIEVAGGRHM